MRWNGPRSWLPWLVAVGLLGLLAVLATLQYHWLGEFSEAQRERTEKHLERSARFFAHDFDSELSRILIYFQALSSNAVHGDARAAAYREVLRLWNDVAPYPGMVAEVLRVELDGSSRELALARYDSETGELEAIELPPGLEDLPGWIGELRAAFARFRPPPLGPPGTHGPRSAPRRDAGFSLVVGSNAPMILLPVFRPYSHRRHRSLGGIQGGQHSPRSGRREGSRRVGLPDFFTGAVVVRLDPEVIREQVLPELAQHHFAEDGDLGFHLRIERKETPGTQSSPPLDPPRGTQFWSAGPAVHGRDHGGDADTELCGLVPVAEARLLWNEALVWIREQDVKILSEVSRDRRWEPMWGMMSQVPRPWSLVATHPQGSLEAAVASTRRRNLMISLGILLILGAAIVLLLAVTRRSERLARRQLEFVAGVTHELRTPLAAMRSAGQNLAAGVVSEPTQVERYGVLIEHEGRRLSDMVEQVLEYAGIQSGERHYRREPIAVGEVIAAALADCRPLLLERGFEVETEIAEVPPVLADAAALRRAVANLIANAVKYGVRENSDEAWLSVRAAVHGSEVRIVVEDRGPGIGPKDLPHLFEPFYRGEKHAASRIPGSGLGLNLVRHICEAHGGRITVSSPLDPPRGTAKSQEGRGSAFTLHLPAAADPPEGIEDLKARTAHV